MMILIILRIPSLLCDNIYNYFSVILAAIIRILLIGMNVSLWKPVLFT